MDLGLFRKAAGDICHGDPFKHVAATLNIMLSVSERIMADPHWTSYVGMASGVLGVFVASFSLYKTGRIKALDLRLELKRAVLDLHSLHGELAETLPRARKSREAIAAAMGRFGSGGTKSWLEEHSVDVNTWREMKESLPNKESSFRFISSAALENKLIAVHKQSSTLQSIKDKYVESMRKDAKDSEFLREQAHKRIQNGT